MNNNRQKLELTWIGKDNPEYDIANIEPRILVENPELSNCANDPETENMLIHGDNLLALKALLPEYEGKVKCIYIDPPYNTGNAFEHYDDSVEHSTWLSLMKPRLELLRMLLRDDGVIFVQIDDVEMAYLKILMDEVFGRSNFINTLVWKSNPRGRAMDKYFASTKEYCLCYSRSSQFSVNLKRVVDKKKLSLYKLQDGISFYKKGYPLHNGTKDFDIDNRKNLAYTIYFNPENKEALVSDEKSLSENGYFIDELKTKINLIESGYIRIVPKLNIQTKKQRVWRWGVDKFLREYSTELIFEEDVDSGNWYIYQKDRLDKDGFKFEKFKDLIEDIYTDEGGKENRYIFTDKNFSFPKPERYLQLILETSTFKNDLVLDSFLGSGTTAAVAQKMGRRYIGIEMGEHAYTHCKVRLDKVIDGSDQGGISKAVEWKGGGGYKFYELAPSFIGRDEFGNAVIDAYYDEGKLVRAMCKLMNFTFAPSQTEYWKQGTGQGKNFLYVTTQLLSVGMVRQIVAHLAPGESLIIAPKKYEPGAETVDSRITVRKIPQSILKACHYGKKEYLLPIRESAIEEIEEETDDAE